MHWSEVGPAQATDREIMAYVRGCGGCILTHDLDFGAILAVTNWEQPSVVQIRADDTSPEVIGKAVVSALVQSMVDIESGALLTIEPERLRVRILPFRVV